MRQKNIHRRASDHLRRDGNTTSPITGIEFNQGMAGVLSRSDLTRYDDLGDLTMPSLDTNLSLFDDSEPSGHAWNSDPGSVSIPFPLVHMEGDVWDQKRFGHSPKLSRDEGKSSGTVDALPGLMLQLIAVSTRATRATRQLDGSDGITPLTVNSPEVNEAFEVANALLRIINSMPLSNPDITPGPSSPSLSPPSPLPSPSSSSKAFTDSSLVLLVLASHQNVLALFRVICGSIQRSLESMAPGSAQQQQALHGDGASSAQFVMVLQLVIHMNNRLSRSLRIESHNATSTVAGKMAFLHPHELTIELQAGGEDSGAGVSQGVVKIAQEILMKLPEELGQFRKVIGELQTRMED